MVLEPLENMDALTLSFLKNKAKEIFIFLKDLEIGIEMEFKVFLNKFQISEATYILALRSQLTPKVLEVFFIKTASKQPLFKAR
jgi:hypothetical protein